jgi:DHA1 family multidrug resistance protein-like MFS transporter
MPTLLRLIVPHYRDALASRELRGVLWSGFVMRLAANLSLAILPLFIQSIAASGARVGSLTGAVTGLSSLAGALGSLGTGQVYERLGGRRLFVIATLVSAAGYLLHLFVGTPLWILPLQVVTGLALGTLVTITRTWLSAVAVAGQEGTAYGLESSSMSLAFALGPLMGSVLAAQFSLRLALAGAAILFVVAAATGARMPDPMARGASGQAS